MSTTRAYLTALGTFFLLGLFGAYFVTHGVAGTTADEGWTITSFHSDITINTNSSLTVAEDLKVDFGTLDKHGIYRYIPVRYRYNHSQDRLFDIQVQDVFVAPPVNGAANSWPYRTSIVNDNLVIQIGDANELVSGPQEYYIVYSVTGAMNAFSDHDELYWNVDGASWPVPKLLVSATVHFPAGGLADTACYEGRSGSTESCTAKSSNNSVTFTANRAISSGEQLSVVTGLKKGVVSVPPPVLGPRMRYFPADAFDVTPLTVGVSVLLLAAGLGYAGWRILVRARDREYLINYYTPNGPPQTRVPVFAHEPVIVEFTPPDNLRPAQLGVVLDERADRKDVTATIVHLAVRGYLTISETTDDQGYADWLLTRTDKPADDLLDWESTIYTNLFAEQLGVALQPLVAAGARLTMAELTQPPVMQSSVQLSKLTSFAPALRDAESLLYDDVVTNGWFSRRPDSLRLRALGLGFLVALAGAAWAYLGGTATGWGLPGIAVAVVGVILIAESPFSAWRTADGHDLMRHTLGFRLYMTTAEKYRQQFAANAGIFTSGLPYAIVFGCVSLWATAFKGIDTSAAVGTWYRGNRPFDAPTFSTTLESMNASLSAAISYTAPSAGGRSGFGGGGGGGAGGGGGGGGGGSW